MYSEKVRREIAEELITDISTAISGMVKQSFPNLPLRVLLQKGKGRIGVLVYWDGEFEEPEKVTYPAIHRARADLRLSEYAREIVRQGGSLPVLGGPQK